MEFLAKSVFFKFTTRDTDGNVGWESGDNKELLIKGDESDGDGNGYIDAFYPAEGAPAPFFSGITFDDVFTAETDVVITVDARTAYYHIADSSGMPADVQTGDPTTSFDGLFANGPFANSVNGWEGWGENLAARSDLQLVDDGTNGDAVAGDSVYTMTLTKSAGEAKREHMPNHVPPSQSKSRGTAPLSHLSGQRSIAIRRETLCVDLDWPEPPAPRLMPERHHLAILWLVH